MKAVKLQYKSGQSQKEGSPCFQVNPTEDVELMLV